MNTEVQERPADAPQQEVEAKAETPSEVSVTSLALVQGTLQAFEAVAAGIANLKHKYGNVVFDCTTVKGMGEATAARMACREPRYAVQNALKEAKKPLNALKSAMEDRAKEIIVEIEAIEEPIHQQIEAELARKEEAKKAKAAAEQQRITSINERITNLRLIPSKLVSSGSADIQAYVDEVAAMEIGDDFAEFKAVAEQARLQVLGELETMRAAAAEREAQDEQRRLQQADLEIRQAEQRRQEAEARQRRQREQEEHEAKMKAERDKLAAEQDEVRKANENLKKARALLAAAEAAAAEALRKAAAAAEARAAEEAQALSGRLQRAAPIMYEALHRIVGEAMEPNIVDIAQAALAAADEQTEELAA